MLRRMIKDALKLDKSNFDECVRRAINVLSTGGVVALPTDTVYGLATSVTNADLLYRVKGRPGVKPIALCAGQILDLYIFSKVTVPESLLRALLPGPVTLVFERSSALPDALNPNTDTVGVRIPKHDFAIELCKNFQPIALTSANISDGGSCLKTDEFKDLWPKIDLVIDGGNIPETDLSRFGSTVVDLSVKGTYKILRSGSARNETVGVLSDKAYGLVERD